MTEETSEKMLGDCHGSRELNLKATELRLGLPGSQSPERSVCSKILVSGAKRGFVDAVDDGSQKRALSNAAGSDLDLVNNGTVRKQLMANVSEKKPYPHELKSQVVGWPPIRSFRKNSMVCKPIKGSENGESKFDGCVYVKVSMDGAPYLRKVDLKNYGSYMDLSSALENMFNCLFIGQFGSRGQCSKDLRSESSLTDLLRGSEYVLTYEDKDGDWMLVGDVPWGMFTNSCKKLRIMKTSDATGLAPRTSEKS